MGKKWKQWQTIFLGSKITADGDWSHEIKRCLLPGREVMTNLDSILKSRDISLATKVQSYQIYGFSCSHVRMWELNHKESWALKDWCFWTVVLDKIPGSPLDFKRYQTQSILKEISPGCSLEGLMLKLKLQSFAHLMRRTDSLEKSPMLGSMKAGGEGPDWGWDDWMASLTWRIWVWASSRGWWWTGRPGMLQSVGSRRVRHDWATELNWSWSSPFNNRFCEFLCP